MFFSIIIPVQKINDYIIETCGKLKQLNNRNFEVIIFPDEIDGENESAEKKLGARIIPSGKVGPAIKRDMASKYAKGEIFIFIDDDSYPNADFLDILEENFKDNEVTAVGGPAITPADDDFWQKVSGAVFLSSFSGGFPERYVPIGKKKYVDDWPSVNLSVRKETFNKIGGFDSNYWPGEDTKLCLDLIERTSGKILYDPNLVVYHHRRKGLFRHLKQIGGYGIHRGFFAKKYPKTSFKLKYFIPSLFLLFLLFGCLLSIFSDLILKIYLAGIMFYVLALIKSAFDIYRYEKNILIILNSIYYIFFTHLTFGFRFIQGFIFTKDLKSKLRK